MRRLFSDTLAIARDEFALFRRFPRLMLAAAAIAAIPAFYALIYLSSVWDPNTRGSALPVALVNLDAGVRYQGREADVGQGVEANLRQKALFGYREMKDEEAAVQAVKRGEVAFAIVIPRNFSEAAVPGTVPGAGRIRVVISEGNNYSTAGIARRFAVELGHQVNQTLNEQRWALVLDTAEGARISLEQLKAGVGRLRGGAAELHKGMAKFGAAGEQLTHGVKQIGGGVQQMESKLPADAELKALKAGGQQLVGGQRELGSGLEQLQGGATRLANGAGELRGQASGIPLVGGRIATAATQLADGGTQLAEGLGHAREANGKLANGAAELAAGSARLADGMLALGNGIHALAAALPGEEKLDEFNAGGKKLAHGAAQLLAGIELLDASLPRAPSRSDGSARGLADSVEPELQVLAPVANNGSAFAPNMVSVALWIGAVMTAYLFNMRLVLREHAGASGVARAVGKYSAPAAVVLLQAVLAFLMLAFVLGVQTPDYLSFLLTMMVASLVFLGMVFALLRLFGEAGKLFAVLLLTLQLAAGGGVMPVELSGSFFQAIHDWLPFTWVVRAFRASLFGAYDNAWLATWATVMIAGGVAFALSSFLGRWIVVDEADYRPGIDV